MSGQSAVGFGFQADIVSTASVGHLLTGRILKAMSDGGVDAYAVAAAVELGKLVPVKKELESGVRTHLMSRRSFTSVLNMALRIGWGHSELAIEMTRTRAGTNAILLIGALTAGRYSMFNAAQCLTELMSIYGCEADRLPNPDVLKGLVSYLAPITFDFSFSKVLQHITTVAERAMRSRGYNRRHMPHQLSRLGSAPMLAGAIKQLILTAERGERMYMILRKHGSWLPAFASHILGMEVEIRYTRTRANLGTKGNVGNTFHDDTTLDASGHTQSKNGDSQKEDGYHDVNGPVIWACAGDQGSVCFVLEDHDRLTLSLYRNTGSNIEIVDSDDTSGHLAVTHSLQDALKNELSTHPVIGEELAEGIHRAVVRVSWTLLQAIRLISSAYYVSKTGHPINGGFDSLAALKETLGFMGIPEPSICVIALPFSGSFRKESPQEEWILKYLEPKHSESLMSISRYDDIDEVSLFHLVADMVLHFAEMAVALMQCRFDASQLRVNQDLRDIRRRTDWERQCSGIARTVSDHINDTVNDVSYNHLLEYLRCLLSSVTTEDNEERPGTSLGFSSSTFTVYYTGLMEHEAYDAYGRMISITSGRASYNGSLRDKILESYRARGVGVQYSGTEACFGPSALAAGSFVEPHCTPTAMKTSIHATLDESSIEVVFKVGHGVSDHSEASLIESIFAFLTLCRVPKCRHDRSTPFRVKEGMEMTLMGFYQDYDMGPPDKSESAIIAVQGNKLHQILTFGSYPQGFGRYPFSGFDSTILQLEACLKCCMEHAGRGGPKSCIIMGG